VKLLANLNELLFPQRCLGCAVLGDALCSRCRVDWSFTVRTTHIENLRVVASVEYSNVVQKIILASKESLIKSADCLLAEALFNSYRIATEFIFKNIEIDAIVPIPSQKSALRKRGRDFITDISREIAAAEGVNCLPILRHRRKVRDQSTLNKAERWNNLKGSLVVENSDRTGPPARVLLIDDLVTTGATLIEASRALRYAGFEVVGAVTAAIAKPLR
jgi:predicted amidophosphoribosyltransferase